MCWPRRRRHPKHLISILVPFQTDDPVRVRTWHWLRRYWHCQLGHSAEIVIGHDRWSHRRWWRKQRPFSKAVAVDNAFKRSHGDIIVILDADAYLPSVVITHCAERIRASLRAGVHNWAVPYRHLYRLTPEASDLILASDPCDPLVLPSPPPGHDVEGTSGSGYGHYFGALCMIMPREAFERVGGMDPRFRGWGSEDRQLLIALDTLWGHHFKTPNDILHMWHPQIAQGSWIDPSGGAWRVRMWPGQTSAHANDWLIQQYHAAAGNQDKMQRLIDER